MAVVFIIFLTIEKLANIEMYSISLDIVRSSAAQGAYSVRFHTFPSNPRYLRHSHVHLPS